MKRFFVASLLLTAGQIFAQTLSDKAFKNVIEIECSRDLGIPKGVICRDFYNYQKPIPQTHLLVDIAIPPSQKTPVVSILPEISPENFEYLFPEFQQIIFITPNHTLNRQKEGKKGEPPVSSVVYFQTRENIIKTDKKVFENNYPEMSYNETDWSKHQEKGYIKVYYTESYGSSCCPRDPKWKMTSVEESVKKFEKKFGKKIHYHQKNNGKEGEKIFYYTLEGLSKNEKLEFILERKMIDFLASPYTKNKQFPQQIFTPYWVKWDTSVE